MPKNPNKNHNKIMGDKPKYKSDRSTKAKELAQKYKVSTATIYRIWRIGFISSQPIPQKVKRGDRKKGRPKGMMINGQWYRLHKKIFSPGSKWGQYSMKRELQYLKEKNVIIRVIDGKKIEKKRNEPRPDIYAYIFFRPKLR